MPYGRETLAAEIGGGRCLGTLDVADAPALDNVAEEVRRGLENPIGLPHGLDALVMPGESVVIIVSDSFRRTGIDQVLPSLLDALFDAGISPEDVSFVFATGIHRAPTAEEQRTILGGPVYGRFKSRAFSHDPYDSRQLVFLGATARGTPVEINRRVHEADRVIATGAVVFHYFAGFGGGRKSIVPGVASARTIAHNHAMNLDPREDRLDPNVALGRLEGNPVAEDLAEATRLAHVDLIVNTVLNREGRISRLFIGDLERAFAAATAYAREVFAAPIRERAGVVIAASPDTRNFVQTHKALFNAHQAVKRDGRVVLVAPCPEGLGGDSFVKWLIYRAKGAVYYRKRTENGPGDGAFGGGHRTAARAKGRITARSAGLGRG
jgi:nickel-dependent lactate racemase